MKISVCIICFNEEINIRRCLESTKWADEIIVVDSMSRDSTLEIAGKYTEKIYRRPWTGYVNQKNFALSKAEGTWILSIDADEEISRDLQKEIKKEIQSPEAFDGYKIPRLSFYQGRWVKHSGFYPDRQLRLFRRSKGHWVGSRVHERVQVQGGTGTLKNNLLHYPYKGSISGQIHTIANFSSLLAENMFEKGEHFNLFFLLLRTPLKFIEIYFFRLGVLDGFAGFVIAVSSAFAIFARYTRLKEIEFSTGKPDKLSLSNEKNSTGN